MQIYHFQSCKYLDIASVWISIKMKIISLFSLFLLLFMSLIALFGTIHEPHYTILANFYLYLQHF